MKQTYTLFIYIAALLLSFISCEDGNDFGTGYTPSLSIIPSPEISLSVSPTSLSFDASAGSQNLTVTTNSTDWNVTFTSETPSNDNSWCTVTKNNGKVTVSVTENSSASERNGIVKVTAGTESKEVIVKQTPQESPAPHTKATTDEASKNTLTFENPASATGTITVESNEEWTVTSNKSWCEVTASTASGNGTVTVKVKENTSKKSLTATVTVTGKSSGDKTEVVVTQKGIVLTVKPASLDFNGNGDSQTLTITCNTDWTVTSSDDKWCKVAKGDGKVTVTVTKNTTDSERNATITVTAGEVKEEVTVTQTAPVPDPYTKATTDEASKNTLTFEKPASATGTITVDSNEEWTVSSSDDSWCKVKANASSVTVTVTANNSEDERKATVTVTGKTSGDKTEITVTQVGIVLTVSTPETFKAEGGSQSLTVTCNTDWTPASSDTSWCSVKKNDGKLTVIATANTTSSERTATVTVTAGEVTREVTVTQKGKPVSDIDINPFGEDENWD